MKQVHDSTAGSQAYILADLLQSCPCKPSAKLPLPPHRLSAHHLLLLLPCRCPCCRLLLRYSASACCCTLLLLCGCCGHTTSSPLLPRCCRRCCHASNGFLLLLLLLLLDHHVQQLAAVPGIHRQQLQPLTLQVHSRCAIHPPHQAIAAARAAPLRLPPLHPPKQRPVHKGCSWRLQVLQVLPASQVGGVVEASAAAGQRELGELFRCAGGARTCEPAGG